MKCDPVLPPHPRLAANSFPVNTDKLHSSAETDHRLQELKNLIAKRDAAFERTSVAYLQQARTEDYKALEAEILLQQCIYHNHLSSKYAVSHQLAYECLVLARELGNASLEANALRMIGVNCNFLGELAQSRRAYDAGIRLLEHQPALSNNDKSILAGLYFNIVTLYREFELDESRLQYINKAHDLFVEIGNKQGIARCYISYANNYPGIKGTQKAIDYQVQAEAIFLEIGDKRGLGNCCVNIGYLTCALHSDFDKGLAKLEEGIGYLSQAGSAFYVINGYFNMACALRLKKDYDGAIGYLQMIEEAQRDSESKMNQANLLEEWSLTLEEKGDYKGALEMRKRFQEEKDKTYEFDKSSAVSDVRLGFELEEKQREANMLKRKNEEVEEYAHKLEISNYELKQFAHVASHDLKEPLRMVTLYLQMLEKRSSGKLDKEELDYLFYAREGATRMYHLINSLLTLSKIDPKTRLENVDLNKVAADALAFLEPQLNLKQMVVKVTELPTVLANYNYMVELFQNLISNAIKYSRTTDPTLEISCMRSDNFYYFSFCDNGIGIEPDYREKVFDIFQRLHSRNEYSGTGIGLTICKKIVEHLHGKIWIEDGKAGGTCCKFTLPV